MKRLGLSLIALAAVFIFMACPPIVTQPVAPGAPTLTVGSASIIATWDGVSGATSYEVFYSTTDTSTGISPHKEVSGTSVTITGLSNGTPYFIWIKAKNSAGTSDYSPSATATPVPPAGAPAAPAAPTLAPDNTIIVVNWSAVTGAVSYEVWYGSADNAAAAAQMGGDITATSYTITGLTNGTTYYVWVKAKNAVGTSGFSPSSSAGPTVPAIPAAPAAPTLLAGDSLLHVTWAAVSGASSYELWYGTTGNNADATQFGGDLYGSTTDLTGLTNWTTYFVWLKAKNSTGTSGFGTGASAAPAQAMAMLVADFSNHRIVQTSDMQGGGWNSLPTGMARSLEKPQKVHIGPDGKIYVVDTNNNRIFRMDDIAGNGLVSFGSYGTGTNQFMSPFSLSIGSDSKIYMADNQGCRFIRMDDMSGLNWTTLPTGSSYLPTDILLGLDSKIYGSTSNNNTSRWDNIAGAGGLNLSYGTNQLVYIYGIAIDSLNNLYVAGVYEDSIVQRNYASSAFVNLTSRGSSTLQTSDPQDVALNSTGNIFIADSGNARIAKMNDSSGAGWLTFGSFGSGTNQFNGPTGIDVNSSGKVFVADKLNDRIIQMDDVVGTNWTPYTNSSGTGTNQFKYLRSVCYGPDGKIYAADTSNNRIIRMDNASGANWVALGVSGTLVGQFNNPRTVRVDSSGKIYVADTGNNRIVRFNDMTGAGWLAFGSSGAGASQFNGPSGIAVGPDGKVYVADTGNNRIACINATFDGIGWTAFGSYGSATNQFSSPYGIAVTATAIFITDHNNHRIVRIDDMTGANWIALGNRGTGNSQFQHPGNIIVGPDSKIYVADALNCRIVRMDSIAGTNWTVLGSIGSAQSQFMKPFDVAIR